MPSSVDRTLQTSRRKFSGHSSRGRAREDRAGAQRPSPNADEDGGISSEKDDYTEPHNLFKIESVSGNSRGSIRSGGHCAGVVARWLVGEVVVEKFGEKRTRKELGCVGVGSTLAYKWLAQSLNALVRIWTVCPNRD